VVDENTSWPEVKLPKHIVSEPFQGYHKVIGPEVDVETLMGCLMCSPVSTVDVVHLGYCLTKITVKGLYLEFGVFEARSLNYCAGLIGSHLIYGFDSFEGFPEAWDWNRHGGYKKGYFSLKGKIPRVRDNVRLVKGWFTDTLPGFLREHPENVAFLHLDADLYSSTVPVLEQLNDRLVPGSIIAFNEIADWGQSGRRFTAWPDHECKAFIEWMSMHRRKVSAIGRNTLCGGAFVIVE
jgi:hypothetical protein